MVRSGTKVEPEIFQGLDDEDEDDELEDWQRELMNTKMQSLVQSKRDRDDRDKRGFPKRRKAALEVAAPAAAAVAAEEAAEEPAPMGDEDNLVLPDDE